MDAVTINSLTDSVYGNLNGKGSCVVPQTIAAGGSYSCAITAFVGGNAGRGTGAMDPKALYPNSQHN